MANKLRNVFNKDDHFIKGNIRFKDVASSKEFRKALETVFKEGRSVQVSGVETMNVGFDTGAGTFPIESIEGVTDIIVSPSPDEVKLHLEVEGEGIEFPVDRYQYQNGGRIQTKENFPFNTTLAFDETTGTAKVNIKPSLDKAEDVEAVLHSIIVEKEFLKKFFSIDLKSGTELEDAFNHLNGLYNLFEKLKFVEETFEIAFEPPSINLDNASCIRDLIELCLLIRDKKVLRSNAKMNDTTGKGFKLASDDEIIIGADISMTFLWEVEYTLWNEKVKIHAANLLNNAIVKSLEDLDEGQVRIVYGEKDENPMFIAYRGFITEAEAKQELEGLIEKKDEYENAKTVEEYMAEEY